MQDRAAVKKGDKVKVRMFLDAQRAQEIVLEGVVRKTKWAAVCFRSDHDGRLYWVPERNIMSVN